jgi:GNAT superfamily N-acetyltransferase
MEEVQLSPRDAGEVLTMQRAAYVTEAQLYGDPFLPPLTQTLADIAADLEGSGIGIRDDGRLVGAVRWVVSDGVAHVGRLMVVPDRQGQGLGTRLLRAVEAHAEAASYELFTGHLSVDNIRLYEREGYEIVRRTTLRDGVDLVHLRKGGRLGDGKASP